MPETVFCYDNYFSRYGKLNIFFVVPPRNLLNHTVLLKLVSLVYFFQFYSRKANNLEK